MRLAISGSHGTGKSTLIAAFVDLRPEFRYEPEAYEALADGMTADALIERIMRRVPAPDKPLQAHVNAADAVAQS